MFRVFALVVTSLLADRAARAPLPAPRRATALLSSTKKLQVEDARDLDNTVGHELVHAFDQCRRRHFERDCNLIACSEVRASAMGECADVRPAFARRQCVRENATLSTSHQCGTHRGARLVARVFDQCLRDHEPFSLFPQARMAAGRHRSMNPFYL